ncbi:MAG: ATP-binding protein [Chloroflexota bacterium]
MEAQGVMMVVAASKVLRECPLFRSLSDEELDRIARLSHEETFEPGAVLFHEGDPPQKVYVIEEGKVAVDIGVRFGSVARRRATIETATRGRLVGWSAVAGVRGYTGAARCLEKTTALVIDGEGLRHLFDEDSYLGYRVMRKLVELVRSRAVSVTDTLAHILSIASHDLKAPLHAVQSYHQVMLGGYAGPLTEKQKDMLVRSGERIIGLLGLIDDILDLSRLEASELEKAASSLVKLAETSIENVRAQANQKGIKLLTEWPSDLADIMVQPARMQQVLTNLLSNAVKFTQEGGEVRVRIRELRGKVSVEVMDNGPGIPEDDLPRIFDDFYRGKTATAGGAGLGLSIAKRVVEAHNGRIWVESPYPESARGAKFTFTLPRS